MRASSSSALPRDSGELLAVLLRDLLAFHEQPAARRRYRRGGFVETAFWIQLGNAFLPSIASVVGMPRMLRLHSLSRAAVTQTYADKWTDPEPFSMAYRLALGILTVGLSLLYAPILPISPFIGLVGITVHYAADQYVALRHSLKPRAFDVEALDAVNYVLRLLPLAQVCRLSGR